MPDKLTTEVIPYRGIKRVKQTTGSYCGPAVLQVLLSHYGVSFDQERFVDAAQCRNTVMDRGMPVESLAKAVHELVPGMSFWMKQGATINDLNMVLNEYKSPVAVNWQGEFESNDYDEGGDEIAGMVGVDVPEEVGLGGETLKGDQGHYSVMVDINQMGGYVRIADPYGHYAGRDRFFAIHDFESRWWDDRFDYLPDGGKRYVCVNKLMFLLLPANLRWPEELGMIKV